MCVTTRSRMLVIVAIAFLGLLGIRHGRGAEAGTADATATATKVMLAEGDNLLSAALQFGATDAWATIAVRLDDGKSHHFRARVEPERTPTRNGKAVGQSPTLPDAAIHFAGLVRYYSRPRLQRYTDKQQEDLIAHWDSLPAASARTILLEVEQDATGVALYLDGQYVGRRDAAGRLQSLVVSLPAGGQIHTTSSSRNDRQAGAFLPLDVKWIGSPGVMKNADISLQPGRQIIHDVPLLVAGGESNVDVGMVKECKGSWALECDEHLSRTALDGMPETAHFSVPLATYTRAWVLCAVEPSPDRDPILTARLTRFAKSGRGDAIADTTLVLPRLGEPAGPGITPVGTVSYQQDGKEIQVPLLLVEFQLKPGEILDLLVPEADPRASMMPTPYLDFEFLGKLDGVHAQWDRRHKPDKESTSAVHVFAATLERSPVSLRLESSQPGNIFHNDERPETSAVLTSAWPCSAKLTWKIRDIEGHTVREVSHPLKFAAAGEAQVVRIPLDLSTLGWFQIDLTLCDDRNRELLTHTASCALLGKDTRRAGYETPYGTWWFAGAHYGEGDKDVAGPNGTVAIVSCCQIVS